MMRAVAALLSLGVVLHAESPLEVRARQMLIDMVQLETANPPGNETRIAKYLEKTAKANGIDCEVLGDDPNRMNFIARLRGSGAKRPLLLVAHSDVVPADPTQWTVAPFSGEIRDGVIYGRGTVDTLGLLAAEMSVLIELKNRGARLARDVIVLSEADEEAGSTGMRWLVQNAWPKIDAEFALNEGGSYMDLPTGERIFQVQTTEKIPTRVVLTARGVAGHASIPRADNAVVHLARAVVKLAEADQPVALNTTTRRYLTEISRLAGYEFLGPLLKDLDDPVSSVAAAHKIRELKPELETQLRTSVSPTMLSAGLKVNVIPNTAEGRIDVRRLPTETREEIFARFRTIVNDPAIELAPEGGQSMPPTEPSSMTTELYRAMEKIALASQPKAVVVPVMSSGATDGSFLRQKGMAVYGVPAFQRIPSQALAHGNDERISIANLSLGVRTLLQIVEKVTE
jgi:acetylornithine deacetylase/succinyl-diaminopimelate desuccinylase-like protein